MVTLIILICIMIFCFLLLKHVKNIFIRMDKLEEKIKKIKTVDDFSVCSEELKKIEKKCWHSSFKPRKLQLELLLDLAFDKIKK